MTVILQQFCAGISKVGTLQQLKDIPKEILNLTVCRLSSGALDFHGLVCRDTQIIST